MSMSMRILQPANALLRRSSAPARHIRWPPGFSIPIQRPVRVIAAAKSRSSPNPDGTPLPQPSELQELPQSRDDLIQELDTLPYAELQNRLRSLGLPVKGKKVELSERLADALLEQAAVEQPGTEDEQQELMTEDDIDYNDMDLSNIRSELETLSTEDLVQTLADFNISTEGTRADLIDRLAGLMEADYLRERETQAAVEAGKAAFTEEEQEMLLAARTQTIREELVLRHKRADLYHELKSSVPEGTVVHYTTVDEMAAELAPIRAQAALEASYSDPQEHAKLREEVEAIKAGGYVPASKPPELPDGAVTGLANCGVALTADNVDPKVLMGMTILQQKKLTAEELRVALGSLGLSTEGNRYKLVERLTQAVADYQMGGSAASTEVARTVASMPLKNLRAQLTQRGLDSTGSRGALEARLRDALAAEQEEMLEEQAAAERAHMLETLGPITAASRLMIEDPPVTVSILFGAPGGSLEDLQSSLEAALCAASGLHTAWPPLVPDSTTESQPKSDKIPNSGVYARLLYLKRDMSVVELPAASLQGITAAELLAGLPNLTANTNTVAKDASSLAKLVSTPLGSEPDMTCVALSVVSATRMKQAQMDALQKLLQQAGGSVPMLGTGAPLDKARVSSDLQAAGFPVMPSHTLQASKVTAGDASWKAGLEAWVDKQGYHHDRQLFVLKPSRSCGGYGMVPARGLSGCTAAAQALAQALSADNNNPQEQGAIVIEPFMAYGSALQFTVTIVDGPDGPLALIPTEIEIDDVETRILDSHLAIRERELMQAGFTADEIWEHLSDTRSASLVRDPGVAAVGHRKQQPFTRMVKYHHPPRLPRNLVHAIRHGAALAYTKLGVKGGARIDGWVVLESNWQEKYERPDDGLGRLLPDLDPGIMERFKKEQEEADNINGQPLSQYYDYKLRSADLSKFDPKKRLHATHNKEATIYLTDVNPGLDLDPGAPVFLQAAQLGMSHTAVLRNLANAALRQRHSTDAKTQQEAIQLEAPPPVDPFELAPLANERVDEFDMLRGVTEWREKQYLLDAEDEKDEAWQLERAEEVIEIIQEAITGQPEMPLTPDGEIDVNKLPYVYADDWGFDLQSAPVEQPQEAISDDPSVALAISDPNPFVERQEGEEEMLRLRKLYPGLPEEDLLYVKLGHGPDGREIDTDTLQAHLAAKAAEGRPFVAVDALAYHLKDPDTNQIGEPYLELYGEESEPGSYKSALRAPPAEEVVAFMREENKFVNARSLEPRKVWLLVGGEPEGADDALRSARDVQRLLSECSDMQVEIFLWSPGTMPSNRENVLAQGLARRTEWLATGFPEDELPEHLAVAWLRNLPVDHMDIHKELVWALTPATALQHNSTSVAWAAENTLQRDTTSYHAQPALQQQASAALIETQLEAAAGGLEGVAGQWGGQPDAPQIPPRLLTLGDFAEEAAYVGAVVMPLLRTGYTAHVLELLDQHGVFYTGPNPVHAMEVTDKSACATILEDIGPDIGCSAMPNQVAMAGAVAEAAFDLPFAMAMMDEVRNALIPEFEQESQQDDTLQPPALCIKPTHGAAGIGVAPLVTPQDLQIYAQALGYGVQYIPANTLSTPHRAIPMPRYPPDTLMFEPWSATDSITVTPASTPNQPPNIQATPESGWVEASICLLGGLGTMEPMCISLRGSLPVDQPGSAEHHEVTAQVAQAVSQTLDKQQQQSETQEQGKGLENQQQQGQQQENAVTVSDRTEDQQSLHRPQAPAAVYITPAPASVLPEDIQSLAMSRARDLVDRLGVHGLVRIDAFISCDTGELIIIEVDTCPSLAQGSLVYQQALHRPEGSLSPIALLRHVVNLGLTANRYEEAAEESIDLTTLGEDEDYGEGGEDEDEDVLAEFMQDDSIIHAEEDLMDDLAELQVATPGVTNDMVGPSDRDEMYLSSTGRAARRGPKSKPSDRTFDNDFDVYGDDFDIDGQGQGMDDPEYQDNWRMNNY